MASPPRSPRDVSKGAAPAISATRPPMPAPSSAQHSPLNCSLARQPLQLQAIRRRASQASSMTERRSSNRPGGCSWPPREGLSTTFPKVGLAGLPTTGGASSFQRPEATGNADMIRIMDPTTMYPNGYVRYYNESGQPGPFRIYTWVIHHDGRTEPHTERSRPCPVSRAGRVPSTSGSTSTRTRSPWRSFIRTTRPST